MEDEGELVASPEIDDSAYLVGLVESEVDEKSSPVVKSVPIVDLKPGNRLTKAEQANLCQEPRRLYLQGQDKSMALRRLCP